MKYFVNTFVLFLVIFLPALALAHDYCVDGIYYNINGNEASVTYRGISATQYSNEYSGIIVIPQTIIHDGKKFPVTAVDGGAFYECLGVDSVYVPNSIMAIGPSAFDGTTWFNKQPNGVFYAGLVAYQYKGNMPNGTNIELREGTLCIAGNAFRNCSGLSSINIPNSVLSIGNYAFLGCSGLTSIIIPNSVTIIGGAAFKGCTGLTHLTIPKSVTSIGVYAFSSCLDLNSIVVENGNSFYDSRNNCNAIIETLTNTLINGCKNTIIDNSVTSIGEGAFSGITTLTNIDFPNSIKTINSSAFMDCSGLVNITIPNSVTSINNLAFYNCSNISDLSLGESVAYIGQMAFWNCSGLKHLELPEALTIIDGYAFQDCSNLVSIVLPTSLTELNFSAFNNCRKISSIVISGNGEWKAGEIPINNRINLYINSQVSSINGLHVNPKCVYCYASDPPSCDSNSFSDYTGVLHVPASSLSTYFIAPYWCNFADLEGDAIEPNLSLSHDSIEIQLNNQFNIIATVTPTNAYPNTVSWRSTKTSVATVNDGVVVAVGIGQCDIIASCFNKQAVCHVVVTESTITITLDQHEVVVLPNQIITLTPSSSSDVLPELSVISSAPTVAAARVINNKVQIVGIKKGTATITVGSIDGTAIPDTCFVTVYTLAGDVNGDNEVNIADVNAVIDQILSSNYIAQGDVNNDGEVNIADVNAIIDVILNN